MVIYNGLDPAAFRFNLNSDEVVLVKKEFGIPDRKMTMLAVGSLTKQKGYDLLFEALQRLNSIKKHHHLIIAGEGKLERYLSDLACNLGIESQVAFVGRSDEVNKLMAVADLLVLSSHWEGLPGVVMEAMASELPVVATDVGGTAELIINSQTGFLVTPADPDRLAEALLKVFKLSTTERKQLGIAGRRRVEQEFHVDKMVKAYEGLYIYCIRTKMKVDTIVSSV
jgi:glycosyltransferase involved in cell wall biosynthesis